MEDEIKELVLRRHNFLLMGNTADENLALRWAVKERKAEVFEAARDTNHYRQFWLDQKTISEDPEFLAAHVGCLPISEIYCCLKDPGIEEEKIRQVMAGMPESVDCIYLKGTIRQNLAAIEGLRHFAKLKTVSLKFLTETPFTDKRDLMLAILGKIPEINIQPFYLNVREVESLEGIFEAAGFRPRPYPPAWEPLNYYPVGEAEEPMGGGAAAPEVGDEVVAEGAEEGPMGGGAAAAADDAQYGEEEAASAAHGGGMVLEGEKRVAAAGSLRPRRLADRVLDGDAAFAGS